MDKGAIRRPHRRASPALIIVFFVCDIMAIVVTWAYGNALIAAVPILLGVGVIAGIISQHYFERDRKTIAKAAALIGLLAMASLPILGILLLLELR